MIIIFLLGLDDFLLLWLDVLLMFMLSFTSTDDSRWILAHNEQIMFFKKQVIMLHGIYSIKNYHYSIINTIIILRLKLYTHGSSI